MKTWVISDTHFYHFNVWDIFEPIRKQTWPKSVDDMNWGMVKNWNEVVAPEDTVWHLGDFAFGYKNNNSGIKNIIRSLNGNIILILGNHDRNVKCSTTLKSYFEDLGFPEVHEDPVQTKDCIFSHEPYIETDTNLLNLHGHLHSQPYRNVENLKGREHMYFNASIECLPGLKPMLLEDILNLHYNRFKESTNGHI